MTKIKQLSALEIRKIAAGEVVERPANVLKELLENSLDAGATQIDIYIAAAGKQLIRVVDNGCGMTAADAELCFLQHATSKITGLADLETLQTYGFRGEALASISAVSRVTLITRTAECAVGTQLELSAGVISQQTAIGSAVGTDLAVHDLFYNVPARQKFLRTTDTEWRQILTLFQAFVLQHQAVNFRLFNDGQLLYQCPASDLATRLLQLWDLKLCEQTLPLVAHSQLTGRISDFRLERYHRQQLFLFVNGRWVKNLGLSKALLKGYSGLLPAGRYPVAILFLQVPLTEVDVNVHPRKEEVRFLRERQIETLVTAVVRQTLEQQVNQQLRWQPARSDRANLSSHELLLADYQRTQAKLVETDGPGNHAQLEHGPANLAHTLLDQPDHAQAASQSAITAAQLLPPFSDELVPAQSGAHDQILTDLVNSASVTSTNLPVPSAQAWTHLSAPGDILTPQLALARPLTGASINADHGQTEFLAQQTSLAAGRAYQLLGQYQATYILVEKPNGLLFVDQHAAHERIIYEKLVAQTAPLETIPLLFPLVLNFAPDDVALLLAQNAHLRQYGLLLEQFGLTQLVVQAVPALLKNSDLASLLGEFLVSLHAESASAATAAQFMQKFPANVACKAAVRAGDLLTNEQMYQLLDDLEQTPNRFTCPHGRPTFWLLELKALEQQFKRDYRR